MNEKTASMTRLEWHLAALLQYGTAIASSVMGVGLLWAFIDHGSDPPASARSTPMLIVTAGIALLILLPVVRVAWMLCFYLRQRDYRFSAITAFILLVIALGFILGLLSHSTLSD
jgi:uncharacterized membrane protein